MTQSEQTSLVAIVSAQTGLSMPEAQKRVAAVEIDPRQAAYTARRVGMILSFWLVAAMFAGALSSSLAAGEGGSVRDGRLRYGAR
jgi:hypothetical protein